MPSVMGWDSSDPSRDADAPTSFFGRLDLNQQGELLGLGRRRSYPARSILFFEGDDAHNVLVVRAGDIKVSLTVDGREIVLDVLGVGDVLGELSAIDGQPRSATATALTAADVVVIPTDAFNTFLSNDPPAGRILMQCVVERLRGASRRQVESGALDAIGRVCRRLVEMAERFGESIGAGILLTGPLSQRDIAAWAGLSREAVVKALHVLRKLGWVTTTPHSITVVDVDAVRNRAALLG